MIPDDPQRLLAAEVNADRPTPLAEALSAAENVPLPTPEFDEDLAEFGPQLSIKDIRQLRALRAFVRTGKVKSSCEAAGIKYATWYRWMHEDPEFARAYEHAKNIAADELEEIAFEKAKEEPSVLMFMLKAHRPERYRERQTITIVSPDVQSRMARQADAILEVCRLEITDPTLRGRVASAIANRLRDIWTVAQ